MAKIVGTPDAEIEITAERTADLIAEQAPHYAGLELRIVCNGWDNCTLRLGDSLAVRVPRRAVAVQLIENEQRFLPQIASWLDVPVPTPLFAGKPSATFPWPWSIVPWLEGTVAADQPLDSDQTVSLATFLRQLHRPANGEPAPNPYRGVPLVQRRDNFKERLERLETLDAPTCRGLDFAQLCSIFERACQEPAAASSVWLHGDLHPKNVLSKNGELAAVIDWGDLTGGDRATDLGSLFMHFEPDVHEQFWSTYFEDPEHPRSTAARLRARGWATMMGVILLDSGIVNDPIFERIGRQILERVLATTS